MSSNPIHGKVYSIQHYVIKFVSDLRQVGSFLWVLRFPPTIKLTTTIYGNWNIAESGVKHHKPNLLFYTDLSYSLFRSSNRLSNTAPSGCDKSVIFLDRLFRLRTRFPRLCSCASTNVCCCKKSSVACKCLPLSSIFTLTWQNNFYIQFNHPLQYILLTYINNKWECI